MLTVSNAAEPFRFAIEGVGEYAIPYTQNLPVTFHRRIRALAAKTEAESAVAMMDLFTDVLEKYAPGAADELSPAAMGEVMGHWAGEGLGEPSPRPQL